MKITFVRHGESEGNLNKTLQDQIKGNLTEKGIEEAKKVAERLSNEKFDFIYCSDSQRTKQTAEEIIKFHKNTPISFVPELREREVGIFVGKSYEELENEIKNIKEDLFFWKPKGGESIKDILERVKNFIEQLKEKHQNKNILLITHGGAIHSLKDIANQIEKPNLEHLKDKKIDSQKTINCCMGIIKFINNKPKLILYNCDKHLK